MFCHSGVSSKMFVWVGRTQYLRFRPNTFPMITPFCINFSCFLSSFQIPADLRLLFTNDLKLENSALTGESEPIDYTSEAAAQHVGLLDSHNIAFNGSLCLDGEGLGIVIRTADNTMIGQIAQITGCRRERKTTLQIEISRFVRFITVLSLCMASVVFIVGVVLKGGKNIVETFINGFIVVIMANVPQVEYNLCFEKFSLFCM